MPLRRALMRGSPHIIAGFLRRDLLDDELPPEARAAVVEGATGPAAIVTCRFNGITSRQVERG